MKTSDTSTCRFCKHFQPEGRRGGFCQQLGASVRGCWNACTLALPPFAPSWENGEEPLCRPTVKVESVQSENACVKVSSSVWSHAHKCQLSVTKTKFNSLKV